MPTKIFNFEKALQQLDNIVTTMERGDMELEKSLQQFEQGVKLIRQCQTALKQAEQQVEILTSQE